MKLPSRLSHWHAIAIVLPIALTPIMAVLLGNIAASGITAGFISAVAIWALRRHIDSLRHRIQNPDGPAWNVELNDVAIGTLDDAAYARFCLEPLLDWRVYWRQAVNLARAALRSLDRTLIAVPAAIFWALVLWIVCDPNYFVDSMRLVQQASAQELMDSAKLLIGTLMQLLLALCAVCLIIFGKSCGLQNLFAEATRHAIRMHLGLAIDGPLSVWRELAITVRRHDPLHHADTSERVAERMFRGNIATALAQINLIATWANDHRPLVGWDDKVLPKADTLGAQIRRIIGGIETNLQNLLDQRAANDVPIDMVLPCPACGTLHVDAPEPDKGWTNPPHKSHLCHHCGVVWRPADIPTNGVARVATRGRNDTWTASASDEPPATERTA